MNARHVTRRSLLQSVWLTSRSRVRWRTAEKPSTILRQLGITRLQETLDCLSRSCSGVFLHLATSVASEVQNLKKVGESKFIRNLVVSLLPPSSSAGWLRRCQLHGISSDRHQTLFWVQWMMWFMVCRCLQSLSSDAARRHFYKLARRGPDCCRDDSAVTEIGAAAQRQAAGW